MSVIIKGINWEYEDFFQDILLQINSGRSVFIQAHGWSMLPLLWDKRDKLELSPLSEESISIGRILLFRDPRTKHYIIHRLVEIRGEVLVLRGDGNPYQYEQCKREDVFAEVRMIIRDDREIKLGDPLWKRISKYWPKSGLGRRLAVGLYRRLYLRGQYPINRKG